MKPPSRKSAAGEECGKDEKAVDDLLSTVAAYAGVLAQALPCKSLRASLPFEDEEAEDEDEGQGAM